MYVLAVLGLWLVSVARGQTRLPGACDVRPGQAVGDVSVLGMLGTWYEVQRVPNADERGDCSTMNFDLIDATIGTITTRGQLAGAAEQRSGTIYKDEGDTGRFVVNYDSVIYDYYVLATDYWNYSIVYGCKDNEDGSRNVWAWLMTRSRDYTPSDSALEDLKTAVTKNPDLQVVTWMQPKQDGCTN